MIFSLNKSPFMASKGSELTDSITVMLSPGVIDAEKKNLYTRVTS